MSTIVHTQTEWGHILEQHETEYAAGLLVFCSDDSTVLLLKNINRNCWEAPGGKQEPSDNLDFTATAIREFEEETSVRLLFLHVVDIIPIVQPPWHFSLLVAAVDTYDKDRIKADIMLGPEHSEAGWFALETLPELPKPMHPYFVESIMTRVTKALKEFK